MRKDRIRQLDLDLVRNRGLLSKEEEQRYIELVSAGYEAPEAEEGQEEEPLPLELVKLHRKLQLLIRDSSTEVNGFILGGTRHWIGRHDRTNFYRAIEGLRKDGETSVPFAGIALPLELAASALDRIEGYAAKCQERTDEHAAAIATLETIEAVEAYDITAGYPDMLNFD